MNWRSKHEVDPYNPLRWLARDMAHAGRPSMEWVVRWVRDGIDPLPAAWASYTAPLAFVHLLRECHSLVSFTGGYPLRYEWGSLDTCPMVEIALWSPPDVVGPLIQFNEPDPATMLQKIRDTLRCPTLAQVMNPTPAQRAWAIHATP